MKKLCSFGIAAIFALSLAPALAMTHSSQMMMPGCKGQMVAADMTTHRYSRNMHWRMRHHHVVMMCEAAARAKGYHMMSSSMMGGHMMSTHMKSSHMKMAAPPVTNPKGTLNTDPGATPNPDNNINGIHTTANPAPTPTP